jgi:hypothetical protein
MAKMPILRDDEIHDAGWIKGEFVDTPEGVVCNEIYNLRKILKAQRDDAVRRVVELMRKEGRETLDYYTQGGKAVKEFAIPLEVFRELERMVK